MRIRPDESVPTVTVEVGGLSQECPKTASESSIIDLPPQPSKLDTLSLPLSLIKDERFRLIADAIENNPTSQTYIFFPAAKGVRDAFFSRLDKVVHRGIDPRRITLVETDAANKLIEVWLVPPGATPPSRCEGCETGIPERNCPRIEITQSGDRISVGEVVTFVANTSLENTQETPRPYVYDWSVSAGTIVSGQGTPSIVVRSFDDGLGPIIASVTIRNATTQCNTANSNGVEVKRITMGDPEIWGPLSFNDERAMMNNAALTLKANPELKLIFIRYLPRVRNSDRARVKKLSDLLVKFGVRRDRFQFVFATRPEPYTVVLIKSPDFDPSRMK